MGGEVSHVTFGGGVGVVFMGQIKYETRKMGRRERSLYPWYIGDFFFEVQKVGEEKRVFEKDLDGGGVRSKQPYLLRPSLEITCWCLRKGLGPNYYYYYCFFFLFKLFALLYTKKKSDVFTISTGGKRGKL